MIGLGSYPNGQLISELPCTAQFMGYPVTGCTGRGVIPCFWCNLVSYCSKKCQNRDLDSHRLQCSSSYMHPSSLWTTQWQKENRPAVFAPPADYFDRSSLHCIWGSSFAYDCLNWARNERPSLDEDITIFFAASGDLRNTIRTVNSLPEGYSGKCRILINDCDSVVACRNALILDILQSAQMLDVTEAAEFCVHLTYSAFLTPTQHQVLASCLSSFMERRTRFDVNDAFMRDPKHLFTLIFIEPLLQMYTSTFDGPTAKRNMHEATLGAARLDNLQSWLWPLRSAHRLAEMHYRRTGVVLPFGVSTSHFTHPNKLLFDGGGKWLPSPDTSPLDGWDMNTVIQFGKSRGYAGEDIYGCFFIYVKVQFVEFARRIRNMDIELAVINRDATCLARMITADGFNPFTSFPKSLQFDRIDTSNILDFVASPQSLLEAFAPLLNNANPYSTIIMRTMDWAKKTPGGSLVGANLPLADARVLRACASSGFQVPDILSPAVLHPLHYCMPFWLDSFYDHEAAFKAFCKDINIEDIALDAGLYVKGRNTIVKERLGFSLVSSTNNLPHLSKEQWYLYVVLGKHYSNDRYIEVGIL